jgi:hypothetical protein
MARHTKSTQGTMEPKPLGTKTLDELRALARTAGLRGYSGLRKKQLIELLVKQKAPFAKSNAAKEKTADSRGVRAKPAKSRVTSITRAKTSAEKPITPAANRSPITEEHIESTKFQMGPPNTAARHAYTSSLHEDIERLPAPTESMLCLLPQKPGVVHAYWTLQDGAPSKPLKLRLCYAAADSMALLEEVDIKGDSGHWYFSVPEAAELGSVIGHLGYYDGQGKFVTAIQRGIARIPALYASAQTDAAWWFSDDDFRAMYERTGGVTRGKKLRWSESASSSSSPLK